MTPSSLALAAMLSLPFLGPQGAHLRYERHRVGPWTITVVQDRFSAATTCRLASHRMDFEREALVIHLPRDVDTSAAVYRVDEGAARSVLSDAMELARQGFALHQDGLDNPSGGLVRIPAEQLANASRVAVQARPGARIWRFRVDELYVARAAARTLGCGPGSLR